MNAQTDRQASSEPEFPLEYGKSVLLAAVGTFLACQFVTIPYLFLPDLWTAGIYLAISVLAWAFVLFSLWRSRQAGALLLDMGRIKEYWLLLILALLGLVFAVAFIPWEIASRPEHFIKFLAAMAVLCSLGSVLTLFALGKVEIREKGILYAGLLMPWSRVMAYRWVDGPQGQVLAFRLKRAWFFSRTMAFGVKRAHEDELAHIVDQRIL